MKRDHSDIDRVLARGHMGGPKHDRILAEVLERTAAATARPSPMRRLWPRLVIGAALASGLGVCVLVLQPAPVLVRAKGGASADPVAVDLRCGPEGLRVCRCGDTLMFEIGATPTERYLSAYAEREGDPTRARIWYFPTSAGMSPVVAAGGRSSVVRKGIAIGAEHAAGNYRVTVVLSSRPRARIELDEVPRGVVVERVVLELAVSEASRTPP